MMHLPRYWIDRRLYEYLAVNLGLRVSGATPILVYQMGKVGSSSVRNSLFRSRDPKTAFVFMSHEYQPVRNRRIDTFDLDPRHREGVEFEIRQDRRVYDTFPLHRRIGWRYREKFYVEQIYRNVILRGRPAKIITLVRDPVAANLSMFFQIFDLIYGVPYRDDLFTVDELAEGFLARYPHYRPVTWFDVEFRTTTGIDVYRHEFARESGHAVITQRHLDVLLLKCETADEVKAEAIRRFVGLDDFALVRSNTAARKAYARQYQEVRSRLVVPDALLDDLYESRYARHFYTDGERAAFRARWSAPPQRGAPVHTHA